MGHQALSGNSKYANHPTNKEKAEKVLKGIKASQKGYKEVRVPHPTMKNTYIVKLIKDENRKSRRNTKNNQSE